MQCSAGTGTGFPGRESHKCRKSKSKAPEIEVVIDPVNWHKAEDRTIMHATNVNDRSRRPGKTNYAEYGNELKEGDDRRMQRILGHAGCNEARTSWQGGWTDEIQTALRG